MFKHRLVFLKAIKENWKWCCIVLYRTPWPVWSLRLPPQPYTPQPSAHPHTHTVSSAKCIKVQGVWKLSSYSEFVEKIVVSVSERYERFEYYSHKSLHSKINRKGQLRCVYSLQVHMRTCSPASVSIKKGVKVIPVCSLGAKHMTAWLSATPHATMQRNKLVKSRKRRRSNSCSSRKLLWRATEESRDRKWCGKRWHGFIVSIAQC